MRKLFEKLVGEIQKFNPLKIVGSVCYSETTAELLQIFRICYLKF